MKILLIIILLSSCKVMTTRDRERARIQREIFAKRREERRRISREFNQWLIQSIKNRIKDRNGNKK